MELPDASFDVAVLWDVIEHVPQPRELVCEIARVLRPGGLIALSTGDVRSWLARLSGPRWHLYTLPEHLSFFSPATIRQLLNSAGFRAERVLHSGAAYSVEHLVHRLHTHYPNRLVSWLQQVLSKTRVYRWHIWVNLWDIMTVFAAKAEESDR
jgi:SAM-dependent methyltransferase